MYHTHPLLIHPSDGQNRTRSRSPYCLHGWACSVPAAARSVDAPACVYHLLYVQRSSVCVYCVCACVVHYHLSHLCHHLLNHLGLFVAYVVFLFYVFVVHYILLLLAAQRMMLSIPTTDFYVRFWVIALKTIITILTSTIPIMRMLTNATQAALVAPSN